MEKPNNKIPCGHWKLHFAILPSNIKRAPEYIDRKKKRWQKIWFHLWERVQTSSMFVYLHRGMERCSRKSITGWKDFRCFYTWKYLKISVPEIVPCYIICRELICLESSTFTVVSLLWGAKSRFLYLKIFPQEGCVILWKSIESF